MNVSELTLDDVRGIIALATDDDSLRSDGIDRMALLADIERWIKLRIETAPYSTRSSWFHEALAILNAARVDYEAGRSALAEGQMLRLENQLNEGNKASSRKTSFVVAGDGVVHPACKSTK